MKGIFHRLPSLASDYSGACSVLFEMGGITALCDASGCVGTFIVLDDPRWYSGAQRFSSAYLKERDIVFGIDKKLVSKIKKTHAAIGGSFVSIVGTPTTAIVGTDYNGICNEIQEELKLPAIGIASSGMKYYDWGQCRAYQKLLECFDGKEGGVFADVHVIGATPLDMWDVNQTNDMVAFLKACGAKAPTVWGITGGVDEIKSVKNSKLNIAVSVSAIPIVRMLEEKYGTPYRIGYPVGKKAYQQWEQSVGCLLSGTQGKEENSNFDKKEQEQVVTKAPLRALIFGEQVYAESIRSLLEKETGIAWVDVASYFTMDSVLKRKNDFFLEQEEELSKELSERETYDIVLGDPFLLRLLPYQPKKAVVLPHTAVSSRAFWDNSPNVFGKKGSVYFAEQLESILQSC